MLKGQRVRTEIAKNPKEMKHFLDKH